MANALGGLFPESKAALAPLGSGGLDLGSVPDFELAQAPADHGASLFAEDVPAPTVKPLVRPSGLGLTQTEPSATSSRTEAGLTQDPAARQVNPLEVAARSILLGMAGAKGGLPAIAGVLNGMNRAQVRRQEAEFKRAEQAAKARGDVLAAERLRLEHQARLETQSVERLRHWRGVLDDVRRQFDAATTPEEAESIKAGAKQLAKTFGANEADVDALLTRSEQHWITKRHTALAAKAQDRIDALKRQYGDDWMREASSYSFTLPGESDKTYTVDELQALTGMTRRPDAAPPRVVTYGELFPNAKGSAFANEPAPMQGNVVDSAKASEVAQRFGWISRTTGGRTGTDATKRAAITALQDRLKVALRNKTSTAGILRQMRGYGLEPQVELDRAARANVAADLSDARQRQLLDRDAEIPVMPTVEDYLEGAVVEEPAPAPAPAPSAGGGGRGRGPGPGAPAPNQRPYAGRRATRAQIAAAADRTGQDPAQALQRFVAGGGTVTD